VIHNDPVSKPAVLIIVENLPVPVDRRVWQECCALRDAGYEVIVVCPKMRGCTLAEEKLEGIQIYRHWITGEEGTHPGYFREYSSAVLGQIRLAWKAWRRHRFKIVHICNPPDLQFIAAWPFKLFFGARIIFDVHDICPEMYSAKFPRRGLTYAIVRLAERLTYACADVALATNESVREVAIKRGKMPPEKVFIVRTSPKVAEGDYRIDPALKKNRKYLVTYLGVMGSADGLEYLLQAAAHMVHKLGRKDTQFLLMGTGPEYDNLVRLRDDLKLRDYVDMPGRVTNEFLFTALKTMDLGVSCDPINSYNSHCTMNKVLEYMAFGKPQVMFDLKEGRASAGDAAVYVPENSAQRFAEAIIGALDDPSARERMGRLAADRLQNHLNWERSVEQLLLAYDTALTTERSTIFERKAAPTFPK
jgi:glycosyltransferase involved in cell wall biosynthesis